MNIPKWLIASALILFVTLIAAVAFLIGRETARPAPLSEAPTHPVSESPGALTTTTASANETASANGNAAFSAGSPTASPPSAVADRSPAALEARARVAAYFQQMDAIQSGGPIGDQQAFATTILGAAVNGDLSGFDNLVRAAADAERRALAVRPPSECVEYHQLAVTLLRESSSMVAALRDGIKRGDADALTASGASAQRLQPRAESLAEAEKALRARFGL